MNGRNRHHREMPLARSPPHRAQIEEEEDPHHHLPLRRHQQQQQHHRGPPSSSSPSPPPPPHHHHHRPNHHHHHHHSPALLEEHLEAQNHEMQSLLLDNQRLAATHVALKQELNAAQKELRHIAAAASQAKADRDAQIRDVYERSLMLEAEARAVDALNSELNHVKSDVQKLIASRLELTAELQGIRGDLERVHEDSQQAPSIKAEVEAMHHELQRGRTAIEYEKKTQAENLEHSQAMEKTMVTMVHEIEKLRAELANAEKRARATAAAAAAAAANPGPGGYAAVGYANPEIGYGGNSYVDPYSMHQVQGAQYGSGAIVSQGPFDMQQNHV